jgi:RNA-directed DNA polymerase
VLTFVWCFVAREFEEPPEEGKQMKTVPWAVYAPTRRKQHWTPDGIDWGIIEARVKRLQMRIAKTAKLERFRRMRSLQWLLAHSYCGKLLAVRRVTSNRGKNTPGVDGVVWRTSRQKNRAIQQLHRRGYRAYPLRRVYIPKKNGKFRPLGIPTMCDRAMQALYALTLTPVAETFADPNSYGFRQGRSCADAIMRCYMGLCQKRSHEWILEADIAACFDTISHQWILDHIPVDRKVLGQWLAAGFLEKGELYPTLKGTPQGGIISPLLMNMTLDGLEKAVRKSVPWYLPGTRNRNGVAVTRYADDFVVAGKTRETLEEKALPAIRGFLLERGLSLSAEKTRTVNVHEGFEFLGQHLRKYDNGKFITKPAPGSLRKIQNTVTETLKSHDAGSVHSMIRRLNQIIRGYCNYHRSACASNTFARLDNWMYGAIRQWLHGRHPNKGRRWIHRKYYRSRNGYRWVFHAKRTDADGKKVILDLQQARWIRIIRHVKIRPEANPYDPAWINYFADRKMNKRFCNLDRRFVEEFGLPYDRGRL